MYFETLTAIGVGSTGASGGTSACARCTMAGGRCMSMVGLPETLAKREKGGHIWSPHDRIFDWRSEVERHACGRSPDGRAADGVVARIARTDLVAVTASTETVVRAEPLIDLGVDDVPAGPVVEVVTCAGRILGSVVAEQVPLILADVDRHR